jgi:SagB-type dehydrogenase family enzyme
MADSAGYLWNIGSDSPLKEKCLFNRRILMKAQSIVFASLLSTLVFICPLGIRAGDNPSSIQLPNPQMESGRPLMQVLKDRMSTRTFSAEKLPLQTLSNLLWAACGVNRLDSGRRTAPSAKNWQEIDIYVAIADGLYLYDAKKNVLNPIVEKDIRDMTGVQPYVGEAPLNLIYVADFSKVDQARTEDRDFLSAADTGFISQNVYLYCASEELATVVRASIDRVALAKEMKLRPDQKITLAQSVGYPKR